MIWNIFFFFNFDLWKKYDIKVYLRNKFYIFWKIYIPANFKMIVKFVKTITVHRHAAGAAAHPARTLVAAQGHKSRFWSWSTHTYLLTFSSWLEFLNVSHRSLFYFDLGLYPFWWKENHGAENRTYQRGPD